MFRDNFIEPTGTSNFNRLMKLSFRNLLISFVALLSFWFIMSGYFDVIHGIMGVASVAVVLALNYQIRKHKYFEDEIDSLDELHIGRLILYLFWLAYQIILSGIQVARILLSPSLPIETQMIRFKVDLPSANAKMILGNSITLTPGTLTVDINGDEFLVHAITADASEGILDDSMPKKVLNLFQKDLHPVVSDVNIITENKSL